MKEKTSYRSQNKMYFIFGGGYRIGEQLAEGAICAAKRRKSPNIILRKMVGDFSSQTYHGFGGAILSLCSEEFRRMISANDFPTINVSNSFVHMNGTGDLLSDDIEVGRLAAEHLISSGYRHFLLMYDQKSTGHLERSKGFEARVKESGLHLEIAPVTLKLHFPQFHPHTEYISEMRELVSGPLEKLPLGSGIFCTNDEIALYVLQVLLVSYPEHMDTTGLLGVDNDAEFMRYYGHIPGLSSVVPPFEDIGEAAMDWFLDHPGKEGKELVGSLYRRFRPKGVVARASTASGGCPDPLTSRVIRWTWEQIGRGESVKVSDMARVHRMHRKTLERRFSQYANCSPGDLIMRLRLDKARNLLRHSRLSIAEISESCGFAKQDVLSRAIRREHGCTPREFRNEAS